jgi:hypothetical protein
MDSFTPLNEAQSLASLVRNETDRFESFADRFSTLARAMKKDIDTLNFDMVEEKRKVTDFSSVAVNISRIESTNELAGVRSMLDEFDQKIGPQKF